MQDFFLSSFSVILTTFTRFEFSNFVVIDGPNVAYFGDQFVHYSTLKRVLDELERMGESPLVTMPWKYVQPTFTTSTRILQHLSKEDRDVIER